MNIDVKRAIQQEYLRCSKDPIYFFKKYVYIQHPTRGRLRFNTYVFQDKVFQAFVDNEYTIILKARQLGLSTLVASYSLWLMLFRDDTNVLCIATTQRTSKNLVKKVRYAYDNLPKWLTGTKQQPTKRYAREKNKTSIELNNGSRIAAVSSNSDAARSEGVTLLVVDEAAFVPNMADTYASAQQTLATGGRCIALSTPNGTANWFYHQYTKARSGNSKFKPYKLHWSVHPERDQSWRDAQTAELGERLAAQECDCDFLTSGNAVIREDIRQRLADAFQKEPVSKEGPEAALWIFKEPDYNRRYIISADVARGDGEDFSACHVIDVDNNEQVAEYEGKMTPREYGNFLVALATRYNDALLVVENANIGWATIEQIQARQYKNLYHTPRGDLKQLDTETYLSKLEKGDLVPGFTMSPASRPLVIQTGQDNVHTESIIIRSERTYEQFRSFVWKNGKPQADDGGNDDLIISLFTGLYIRKTALNIVELGQQLARTQLDMLSKVNKKTGAIFNAGNINNGEAPYRQTDVHGNEHDIKWLL